LVFKKELEGSPSELKKARTKPLEGGLKPFLKASNPKKFFKCVG